MLEQAHAILDDVIRSTSSYEEFREAARIIHVTGCLCCGSGLEANEAALCADCWLQTKEGRDSPWWRSARPARQLPRVTNAA